MIEVSAIGELVSTLLKDYGPAGGAFGCLFWLLWRNNRRAEDSLKIAEVRMTELENKQAEMYLQQIASHKEVIAEYVGLVKSKIEILEKLTNCINTMNSTLTRIENK